MTERTFFLNEYGRALRDQYPDRVEETEDDRYVESVAHASELFRPKKDRFQDISRRHFGSAHNAWGLCRPDVATGISCSYKGLILTKTPFDLVLYSNLIWELQPGAILEFGSLQGGSGLWFADQLDIQCGGRGEVHSFDLRSKCVSPRAQHPRLHFHRADLREVSELDAKLLERLPHPWLVVDDAHVNVLKLVTYVNRFMQAGDYYVLEDLGLSPTLEFVNGLQKVGELGFVVDTSYTDAFGYNVTAAPNGWLRKMDRSSLRR